jgi:hypothetical protein
MTDAIIEAIASVLVVFSGMRVLYGSWPWEGHKTWYSTRRLLQDKEGISLTPEQIVQAVASAASITNGQQENTKGSEISSTDGNPLVVEIIPACVDPTVKQPNPLLEAVVSIQSFIEETAAVRKIDARRSA